MSAGLENTAITPVYLEHKNFKDTAIPSTPFDPRLGGYDVGIVRPYVYPKPVPDFQGQLIAWYEKIGSTRYCYLLIGHDANDGQGLRWIEAGSSGQGNIDYIDPRTTEIVDPYYLLNCNPPWVCE